MNNKPTDATVLFDAASQTAIELDIFIRKEFPKLRKKDTAKLRRILLKLFVTGDPTGSFSDFLRSIQEVK